MKKLPCYVCGHTGSKCTCKREKKVKIVSKEKIIKSLLDFMDLLDKMAEKGG